MDNPCCETDGCSQKSSIVYQCEDCAGAGIHCAKCITEYHRIHPFHRLQQWNKKSSHPYFKKVTLADLDYEFCLGHQGQICPSLDGSEHKTTLTFVDVHGVFQLAVQFCVCSDKDNLTLEPHLQLLQHRLYPATKKRPSFAFSFRVLEHFHRWNLSSKTSAFDYCEALKRLTNPVCPDSVTVSSEPIFFK